MDFLSFLPTIFKGVTGLGQLFSGLFSQPQRPVYDIPQAEKDALKASKALASQTKLPGQDILETQLGEKTANMTKSLERMGSGGAGLAGLASIYAKEAEAKRNLAGDAARYYMGNKGQLINELNQYAQYEDKKWQKNIGDKYQEEASASSALTQAGIQNTASGLGDLAGWNAYSKMFGNNKSETDALSSYMGNVAKTNPIGPQGRLPYTSVNTNPMNWVKIYKDLYGNGMSNYSFE